MKHDAVNVRPSGEFRGQLSAQSRKGTLNYSMKYEDLGALCSGSKDASSSALSTFPDKSLITGKQCWVRKGNSFIFSHRKALNQRPASQTN